MMGNDFVVPGSPQALSGIPLANATTAVLASDVSRPRNKSGAMIMRVAEVTAQKTAS
jgi:hypothetical protein